MALRPVVALLLTTFAAAAMKAQDPAPQRDARRTVAVQGFGTLAAEADQARLAVQVATRAETASEAMAQDKQKTSAVLKMLRDLGVEAKDIQTSRVNVAPVVDYQRNIQPPPIVGYTGTNEFMVLFRGPQMEKVGTFMDRAVNAGVTGFGGIGFENSRQRTLEQEALKRAAADATYPRSRLPDVVRAVSVERLLVETDAPYLAPQGRRGRRNEPAFVAEPAAAVAAARGLAADDVRRITTRGACSLFRLPCPPPAAAIAYPIRDSLYLNVTNRCTSRCVFCRRERDPMVKGHNLRLEREPTDGEVLAAAGDVSRYDEVVFCGYGEPLLRWEVVRAVARALKARGARIRINTNGQVRRHEGRDILPEMAGIVDALSVSLNAPDADPEAGHNVHRIVMHPRDGRRLNRQCYNGTYRSDDGGRRWNEITAGLPSDFGYAIACDPNDPGTVFQVPESGADLRITVDARLRVYRSRDGGHLWASASDGLPQEHVYVTVLREALDTDDATPCGVYFGTSTGHLFASRDGGNSWGLVAAFLPRILSVTAARQARQ